MVCAGKMHDEYFATLHRSLNIGFWYNLSYMWLFFKNSNAQHDFGQFWPPRCLMTSGFNVNSRRFLSIAQHVLYYTHTTFCIVQIHHYEMFHASAMKLLHLPAKNSVVGPGHRFVFKVQNTLMRALLACPRDHHWCKEILKCCCLYRNEYIIVALLHNNFVDWHLLLFKPLPAKAHFWHSPLHALAIYNIGTMAIWNDSEGSQL